MNCNTAVFLVGAHFPPAKKTDSGRGHIAVQSVHCKVAGQIFVKQSVSSVLNIGTAHDFFHADITHNADIAVLISALIILIGESESIYRRIIAVRTVSKLSLMIDNDIFKGDGRFLSADFALRIIKSSTQGYALDDYISACCGAVYHYRIDLTLAVRAPKRITYPV